MAEPIGAPSAISREYPNDVARLRPCLMKNTGSQVTNPYNNVLMVIRHTEPTIMRESKGAVNSVASSPDGGAVEGAEGAGSGRPWAASRSIDCISASASSVRPTASSQRRDSGTALRTHQKMSAPMPPSPNIARQPNSGTASEATSSEIGKPVTTHPVVKPSHLPRERAGTNSVIVA